MSSLKTYVALILDKSGSMSSIRDQAVNYFNEQLQILQNESSKPAKVAKKLLDGKDSREMETFVTFVTFNQAVETPIFNKEVNELKPIENKDYKPDGMTAFYDAMGSTIDKFLEIPDINDPEVAVLFIAITDGQENDSKEYKGEEGRKRLKSKIEELGMTNRWTFTYLGANQDVLDEAVVGLAMGSGNVMTFSATDSGMSQARAFSNAALSNYYSARAKGLTSVSNYYSSVTGDAGIDGYVQNDKSAEDAIDAIEGKWKAKATKQDSQEPASK